MDYICMLYKPKVTQKDMSPKYYIQVDVYIQL